MSVTCLIPTCNEASRISYSLDRVIKIPAITQIVVIDDGSTDNLAKIVNKYPQVTLLSHSHNQGKVAALKTGFKVAKNDTILTLDADLYNYQLTELSQAIKKFHQHPELSMLVLTSNTTQLIFRLTRAGIFLSGQRLIRRDLLNNVLSLPINSYQIEVALTNYCLENNYQIAFSNLSYKNLLKHKKTTDHSLINTLKLELKMLVNIFSYLPFSRYLTWLFTIWPPKLT